MTFRRSLTRLGYLAQLTVATMLGVLLAIVVFTLASSAPGHPDIARRLDRVETQLTYVSCLLLIEPADRTPERVADCQVNPASLP